MHRAARPRPSPRAPSDPAPNAGIRPWQIALALALLHLAVVVSIRVTTPFEGGDNAAYLALAESLRGDGSYRELWDPAEAPHTQYPPVWPLVLAAALTAGVQPWAGIKLVVALFSAAAVALSYLWARRVSSGGVAFGVGVVLAIGYGVADLGRTELADTPFWAFTMLALWGFSRLPPRMADGTGVAAPPPRALGALAAATAGVVLAYGTRSAGLPLIFAALGWLAWTRRWRALATVAGVIAPFALAWAAYGARVGGGGYGRYFWMVDPYRPELGTVGFSELWTRVARNSKTYVTELLPELLVGTGGAGTATVLGATVVGLAAVGWAMRTRRGAGVAEWLLPLYLALVLLWPAQWAGTRFLLPLLPLLLVAAGDTLAAMASRAPRPVLVARAAGGAAVVLLAAQSLPRVAAEARVAAQCRALAGPMDPFACMRPAAADFLRLARELRGALPEGSAVLSRKPTLFWAESRYPSRVFPYTSDPGALIAAAREVGARYVVLDSFDNIGTIHLIPAVAQRQEAFCVVRTQGSERATILGIRPGAESMPNTRPHPGTRTLDLEFSWCPPEYVAPGVEPPGGWRRAQ